MCLFEKIFDFIFIWLCQVAAYHTINYLGKALIKFTLIPYFIFLITFSSRKKESKGETEETSHIKETISGNANRKFSWQ